MPYYDPEEVLRHIYELLKDHQGSLGLGYVAWQDENLIPEYPAVRVTAEPVIRETHGTGYFKEEFNMTLWVYHAQLSDTYQQRSEKDMLLASAVRNLLHEDYSLGGNIHFGYVTSENPGVITTKNVAVVGTRMTWFGEQREPYHRPV